MSDTCSSQYGFINTRPEFLISLSPPYSSVMVRLSTVLGFAFAAASVLIPGVLSQDIPACAQACAQTASDSSGCSLYVEFRAISSSVLKFLHSISTFSPGRTPTASATVRRSLARPVNASLHNARPTKFRRLKHTSCLSAVVRSFVLFRNGRCLKEIQGLAPLLLVHPPVSDIRRAAARPR